MRHPNLCLLFFLYCITQHALKIEDNAVVLSANQAQDRKKDHGFDSGYRTILTKHFNRNVRRHLNSSDMKYMAWDESLEDMAKDRTLACNAKIENIYSKSNKLLGLNVYIGQTNGVKEFSAFWEKELEYFNKEARSCDKENECGNYAQIVYSNSERIGCSYTGCLPNRSLTVVCLFNEKAPVGKTLYKVGTPCTRCESEDGGLCYNKSLCITRSVCSSDTYVKKYCSCGLTCAEDGKLVEEKCRCNCSDSSIETLDCTVDQASLGQPLRTLIVMNLIYFFGWSIIRVINTA